MLDPRSSSNIPTGSNSSGLPWFLHVQYSHDGEYRYRDSPWYDSNWKDLSPGQETSRLPYSNSPTFNEPCQTAPSFEYHDFDSLTLQACFRIVSSSLRIALLEVMPYYSSWWKDDTAFITCENILLAAVKIQRMNRVHDQEPHLYREIELLFDFAHGVAMYPLGYNQGSLTTVPFLRKLRRPTSPWVHFQSLSLVHAQLPDDLELEDPETYKNLVTIRNVCELEGWKDMMSRHGRAAVWKLDSKEMVIKRNIEYTLQHSCSKLQQAVMPTREFSWFMEHSDDRECRELYSWLMELRDDRECRELYTFASEPRLIWRRGHRTIRNILNNSVSSEGLSAVDAVSLVLMADCLRFVPGLELYRFFKPDEYVQPCLLPNCTDKIDRFNADLPRYAQMVKCEDRLKFNMFVAHMYGVNTFNSVSFELTGNVHHFRELFNHISSEINGSSPNAEDSVSGEAFPDAWMDEFHADTFPSFPTPVVCWDPGEIHEYTRGLLLAVTVIFGLVLAYLLGQLHFLILPLHVNHLIYLQNGLLRHS